jgi:hypothetical protein
MTWQSYTAWQTITKPLYYINVTLQICYLMLTSIKQEKHERRKKKVCHNQWHTLFISGQSLLSVDS